MSGNSDKQGSGLESTGNAALPAAGAGSGNVVLPPAGAGVEARAACRVDLAGGTMDMWPLYLFHPGAVVVNIAVQVMTRCRIMATEGEGIELVSLDTGLADRFADMQALREARRYKHGLAVHLLRFFYAN